MVYSSRNPSNGEIELARKAGTKEAACTDGPSATTAARVTTGSYGRIKHYDIIGYLAAGELTPAASMEG